MKKILALLLISIPAIGFGQGYNVALIPDSLKENANAVKRFEELRVIIKGIDRAVVKHKYAITVLNVLGDRYAQYYNDYSKLHSLSDIDGNLYDASGKKLKNVKKKDIADLSSSDEESLISDTRYKAHNFYYKSYPYTIEYEDEQEYNGIFFLPHWMPVQDEKFAVQQSSFIVETPADYALRYKQFNYPSEPEKQNNAKGNSFTWTIKNVAPIEEEMYQPGWKEVTTSVFIAPSDFGIGDYKGDMRTWKDLGKFIATLNAGRDVLPENVKADIHKISDGIASKHEKVKLLYEYMQKNTRYISIQLGIGSWQPFDAKYVAAKKYGDCKALSNFMKSILKEAGITSNYVLISAGEGKKGLWEDFPSPYFSHAILCVPDAKDTIWLECTSQTVAAGFMGSFTGNRKALMIADDGGYVVSTPTYEVEDNLQIRTIKATINEEGNLEADVHTEVTGIKQELQHVLINHVNKEQREKYLNNTLNLPTYQVDKINYTEIKKTLPVVDEDLHVLSPNYANITGKRLFIRPNLFNKSNEKLPDSKKRKFNIVSNYAFKEVDSAEIRLPAGYQLEATPKDVVINNKFGSYAIRFKTEGDKITAIRSEIRQAAEFPPSDYPELVKYFDAIYKADRSQLVFVKKEN